MTTVQYSVSFTSPFLFIILYTYDSRNDFNIRPFLVWLSVQQVIQIYMRHRDFTLTCLLLWGIFSPLRLEDALLKMLVTRSISFKKKVQLLVGHLVTVVWDEVIHRINVEYKQETKNPIKLFKSRPVEGVWHFLVYWWLQHITRNLSNNTLCAKEVEDIHGKCFCHASCFKATYHLTKDKVISWGWIRSGK